MRGTKRGRRSRGEDNGFAEWGGYMAAKKSKLQDQFKMDAVRESSSDSSQIFHGIAIFVNGYSVPSADELKLLMMKHGGIYHHYYRTDKTTHIIATNLPDTKVKQLKNMNVVKPDWIVESIAAGKLLDYRQFLLYSRQSKTQPKLMFKQIPDVDNKSSTFTATAGNETDIDPCGPTDFEESSFASKGNEDSENSNYSVVDEELKVEQNETKRENTNVPSTSKSSNYSIKTASEAGFLSEFYSNSRLHHISTMGAMFKQYVNTLRQENSGLFLGKERLKTWKQSQVKNHFLSSSSSMKHKNIIMHIDMDCFFVSVGLRKRPELRGLPVAVTHAKAGGESSGSHRAGVDRRAEFDLYKARTEEKFKPKDQTNVENGNVNPWSNWVEAIDESNSMSEIASCNYEARKLGLKNGMFLGQALKLCPNLKTIPYDFEGYKEVSHCLYDTIASYTVDIEAVSCDEMFVDCTSLLNSTDTTPLELATMIRAEIKGKTGCPCSTGFGSNRLQARLATRRAKPDGQFHLEPAGVQAFMQDINVADLPGVGRSTSHKLASLGVKTCLDLQAFPLSKLQSEFGVKSGDSLYRHCRGEDIKKLVFGQVRKSVSAEVNYGIRFQSSAEADTFLQELSKEVHHRLQEANMKTKFITLKLMVKAKDAPAESAKFLGHGVCDQVSRSSSLSAPVCDLNTITREVMSLTRQLNIEPTEMRGIGIQLSRLESTTTSKPGNVLDKFLRPKTEIAKISERDTQIPISRSTTQKQEVKVASSSAIDNFFAVKKHIPDRSKPSSSGIKAVEIDRAVLGALPEDIRKEVMREYGLWPEAAEGNSSTDILPKEPDKTTPSPVLYDCGFNYSQIDLEVLDELPADIKKEIQLSVQNRNANLVPKTEFKSANPKPVEQSSTEHSDQPRLDRNLPLDEVRALIKAWTSSEDSPQGCDVLMLADYLEGLVVSRQLVSLDICVSCLHRCIEKRHNELWQGAYFSIVDSVQSVMVAVYGLHLSVPNTFT